MSPVVCAAKTVKAFMEREKVERWNLDGRPQGRGGLVYRQCSASGDRDDDPFFRPPKPTDLLCVFKSE